MAFAFVEGQEFAGSGASAAQNYRGDAAPPAAGSMLVAYVIASAATPTPSGYTAIGAPKVVTDVSGTLYHTVFWKIANGIETALNVAWSGSQNYTGNVRYYTDPPVASLYEILSVLSTDGGTNTVTQDADATADGQPYLVFWGGDFGGSHWYSGGSSYGGATFAHFSGTSFFGSATGLASADDLASGQVATDRFGVGFGSLFGSPVDPTHCAGYFLAFGEGNPSVDGESDGGLFLGSASPTVTNLDIEGESAGGLLLGSAEGSVEGGELPGTSAGGLLRGSASPTVVAPVPPIPVPAITNVVGCGVYEVIAFTRGGGEIVGSLEFDSLAWGRQLDATSAASITIDGVTNLGALERCCALLGSLNPWEHEIAIYREVPGSLQKRRVWMGPITRMRFPNESVVIEALDLSGWLQRRTLHENHNFVGVDLIDMWVAWVEDAMSVDNSPGLVPTVLALSGILADRLTTIVDHSYAADAIAEIATTGIDWTVIDRVMQAGPVLPQPAFDAVDSLPLLLDEAFRVAPEIIVDGMSGANCWYVNGGGVVGNVSIFGEYGPEFAATPDHVAQPAAPDYAAIEAIYGRVELVVSETRILDQPSIDQAAVTRYDLTKNPVPFITGGELVPTAPLPVSQMIPGALLRVKLNRACKPIDAVMRIQSVSIAANADGSESVDLGLEPIGTVSNG